MEMQKRWLDRLSRLGDSWWPFTASAIFFAVVIWLVADALFDQKKSMAGFIILPLFGLLFIVAQFKLSWKPEYEVRTGSGLATVVMTLLQATMAVTAFFFLFEPRAATTSDTDAIREDTQAIGEDVDELKEILRNRFPANPPILTEILGRWGEQDTCALVWEISIVQRGVSAALEAEIVTKPDGVEPYRLMAEITDAEGYSLDVTAEEPPSARGSAAVFTLNPATQRLVWDDKASAGGVEEYVRCLVD